MASQAPVKLRFVIAGAGLGGLSASIGLAKAGHEVEIMEQSSQLREVGAGIQIPPNSTSVLKNLGVLREVEKYAVVPYSICMHRYSDGEVLSLQNLVPHCGKEYGSLYLLVHRADFHHILVTAAQAHGVKIRLNSTVKGVDFSKPGIELVSGEVVEGDVVIAADGLRSRCREALLGRRDSPILSGSLTYRVTLDPARLLEHDDLRDLIEYPEFHCWIGPHSHVVFYPMRVGELCNLVIVAPDNLQAFEDLAKANMSEIKDLMKDWEPRIQKLMGMATSTSKWRLQDNVELERWMSDQGTFTMLGDACHAMIPYLAQGAAQAVEDAGTLVALFENLSSKQDIPETLRSYEKLRKSRTSVLAKESADFRRLCQVGDGPEQLARDKLLHEVPVEGCPNRWADPVFQKWLWGHNVDDAVRLLKASDL
ncbi:hypothetical protein BJ878DRAFT_543643 [Calycina marina]|uniref:FAD-binding domain-containing protein n=1 Tax=Calycina marina TaxID=1763456 RepID=A0A9P7YZZ0_9HELO|nr:hypothetical protein BJ878DRAFT_543643 [Calycina marina]